MSGGDVLAVLEGQQATQVNELSGISGQLPDQAFARGVLEGLSIAKAECDRLTNALDYGGNEYRRPASADQCANSLRKIYAVRFRDLYPLPTQQPSPGGAK